MDKTLFEEVHAFLHATDLNKKDELTIQSEAREIWDQYIDPNDLNIYEHVVNDAECAPEIYCLEFLMGEPNHTVFQLSTLEFFKTYLKENNREIKKQIDDFYENLHRENLLDVRYENIWEARFLNEQLHILKIDGIDYIKKVTLRNLGSVVARFVNNYIDGSLDINTLLEIAEALSTYIFCRYGKRLNFQGSWPYLKQKNINQFSVILIHNGRFNFIETWKSKEFKDFLKGAFSKKEIEEKDFESLQKFFKE